jgi:predicted ABC-class ATPase
MDRLKKILNKIDSKGYKAYKNIQGIYQGEWFKLYIDYVQGDPFASPSRIRLEVSQEITKYHKDYYSTPTRLITFQDFLARELAQKIKSNTGKLGGTGKSGLIAIDTPGQEVLSRTAIKINHQKVEIRLSVGLPAKGRTILGKSAAELLCEIIPDIIKHSLFNFNEQNLIKHLHLADQQEAIRSYLDEHGYVAFIANGAILPRESGISNRPLKTGNVIAFQSPPTLEIEIPIPHKGSIKGMGIPRGVTLIVGGGYHGKSTLLKAIERGVYNHIPGDGREYVLTNKQAYKIRAEDGRRVEKVNISPFINNLPFGQDTTRFSSEDASGSTSQAANIMEALETGAEVLLMDEDTSATNFMIRDARMQELVAKGKEPITPFIDKVRQLYNDLKISTILVIGGSGDYLEVADTVIMMDEYRPVDVTKEAKEIVKRIDNKRHQEGGNTFGEITHRIILPQSFNASRGRKEKVDAKGLNTIIFGINNIDLSLVEQLVDTSQTRAIAEMIRYFSKKYVNGQDTLSQLIKKLYIDIEINGLDIISPYYGQHPGDLALPRPLEVAAAINRLRSLKVK